MSRLNMLYNCYETKFQKRARNDKYDEDRATNLWSLKL
jgi:hypothetical protein